MNKKDQKLFVSVLRRIASSKYCITLNVSEAKRLMRFILGQLEASGDESLDEMAREACVHLAHDMIETSLRLKKKKKGVSELHAKN